MRNVELVFLLKLLLNGARIFPVAPIIISPDRTVKTLKKLKYFFIGALIPICGYLIHYYLLTREAGELRSDPYLFLGFARGFVSSALPCLASGALLSNCEYFTKSLKILCNLQKNLHLSQKKLNVMFWIILIELAYLYLGCGIWGFILYSFKTKNLIYRIGISILNSIMMVTIMVSDIFYINSILLIGEYFNLVNKKLQNVKNSSKSLKWAYDVNTRKSNTEKIRNLRNAYREIFDAKEIIHKCFSWPLLMSISLVFFDIVFFAFLTILRSQIGVTIITVKELLCVRFSCYGLIARLIIMVAITDWMSKRMKRTGLILADLTIRMNDNKDRKEIKEFMQEFRLMEPAITASGFVTVDYDLLKGILGTITVYVIILIQFKLDRGSENPISSLMYYY